MVRVMLSPLASLLVLLLLAGCGSDSGDTACVPGAVSDCPCLGGGQGVQSCLDDGSGYGFCVCTGNPETDLSGADVRAVEDGLGGDGGQFDLLPGDLPEVLEPVDVVEVSEPQDLPGELGEELDGGPETLLPDVFDVGPELVADGSCVPDCAGKNCGSDGCGGTCGECQDDANPCTDSVCQAGICTHEANNVPCNDGNICTVDDTCSGGVCSGVDNSGACDDQLPCTDDSCDPVLGCLHVDNGQPCQDPEPPVKVTYDLVVVGAGSGGTMAAIQAARMGLDVALLEETDWVGGQMTAAGVTSMDEGYQNRDSGLYKEFIDLVKAHYAALGKSIGTCYWSTNTYCFEAKVGRAILLDMIGAEPNIDLYLRMRPTSVPWQVFGGHPRVTGLHATMAGEPEQPYEFKAALVIDATEWGDVLALSPAPYRIANSTSSNIDAGACVQDNTYTAVIRKYTGGVPAALQLMQAPPGYNAQVVDHFESIVQNDGWHWLSGPNNYPADWLTHVGYRGMPDSAKPGSYTSANPESMTRTGVNWANDYPYVAADLDPAVRFARNCEAKLRTLQFLYYMQHELGQSQWSVANDEGYDSAYNLEQNSCPDIPAAFKSIEAHLPVMPYARESRRVIGLKTVTAGEIRRIQVCAGCPARAASTFKNSLAVGDYPVDLHACNDNGDLELAYESTADVPPGFQGGPFQVPFEAFVPQTVDGLLVAEKNLSVTRLVNGAIRLQPITMLTGQAAGAIAAHAIQSGTQPRNVSVLAVQQALIDAGSRLAVQSFADVPRSSSYWEVVQLVATREVLVGYSDIEFGINDEQQRGWAAALIARLFDVPVGNPPAQATFDDVPTSHPAYEWVEALVAAGLTNGCSAVPKLYCPDDPLTRAAMATFIVNGMGWNPGNAPANPYFDDLSSAAEHWSFPYVQLVAQHGLMAGCGGGDFCPDEPIVRGELAQVAAAVLLYLGD